MKQFKQLTKNEWLEFLENRHQQEIQLGLSRISQVAKLMGLNQVDAKVITVAGTNGKGSTVASLEAIYLAAGYQVASYTSPHLLVFNERIRLNQKPITDEDLCEAFSLIEEARGEIALSYFEVTTLAAFWYFKQHALDLIILEVGLGGRLDATNIIDADLAIITTIDFDHQQFLGNTKEAIGYEKAGILRKNKPVIFADTNPPKSILIQAEELETPCFFLGKHYDYFLQEKDFKFVYENQLIQFVKPSLHPNAVAAALMASFCLQKELPINDAQRIKGLKTVFLAGRLQLFQGDLTTLFDVAHNPQSVSYLTEFIKNLPKKGKIHAVFSALKDKDLQGLVEPLKEQVDYWYLAMLSGKRAASTEQLMALFANTPGLVPLCYSDPLAAYQAACNEATADDLIIVYGSFITVGKVLATVYNSSTKQRRQNETSNG